MTATSADDGPASPLRPSSDARALADSLTLVAPRAALKESYRAMIDEIVAAGEKLVPFPLAFPHDDFEALVAKLAGFAQGIDVPEGFVPHSTYWLVQDGVEVVGASNLRHTLTPALRMEGGHIGYGIRPSARRRGFGAHLLRLTLGAARERGLASVLLTCAKANVASARTIERNGGVLVSEAYLEARREAVRRYWVPTAPPAVTRQ